MSGLLYKFNNYISHYSNIINSDIKCYDIKQANINILYDAGVLDDELYNKLSTCRKIDREVYIGKMIKKNKKLSAVLDNGFLQARKDLFEANDINDSDVLSIKKDAVYLIEKPLTITRFNSIYFRLTDEYTSFYRLKNLELYYNGRTDILSVKGIGDETLNAYHNDHFCLLLKAIFKLAEKQDLEFMMNAMKKFISMYLNFEMDIECYREFNRISSYRLKFDSAIIFNTKVNSIGTMYIDNSMKYKYKEYLDISYNYNILLELYGFYFDRYMDKM